MFDYERQEGLPAGDHTLARPEIAEALELIYLDATDGHDAEPPEGVDPVDIKLARDGLTWITQHLPTGDSAWEKARDAQLKLHIREEEAAQQAEEVAYQERLEQELDTVIGAVTETHPHLNVHGFFQLAHTLGSDETAEEGISVYPTRQYHLALGEQIHVFLEEPERLINDVSVARYAADFFADAGNRLDYPVAAAHVARIAPDIGEALLQAEYKKDLPASRIDQWFTAVDVAKEPDVAANIIETSGVLQRTLLKIVHKDPIRFIDRLHALGMRGIRPDDELSTTLALSVMKNVLETDPMAACSLVQGSYFAEDPKKANMQRRAMDIVISLDTLLGVHMTSYYSHDRYNSELDSRDRHLLERHLVPTTSGGRVDYKTWEARTPEEGDKQAQRFISGANTKDGATSTIYGRVAHYRRRNSRLGRLFRMGRQDKPD